VFSVSEVQNLCHMLCNLNEGGKYIYLSLLELRMGVYPFTHVPMYPCTHLQQINTQSNKQPPKTKQLIKLHKQ
jgi:hypothetical protein